MYIKSLHIASFGRIREFTADFSEGINIIEGKNESGKSTLLSFIKFMLYGADTRPRDSFTLPEKRLFMPWDGTSAKGSLRLSSSHGDFIVERELLLSERRSESGELRSSYRERVSVLDEATGAPVSIDRTPGEYFFGVPEEIFRSTALVGQVSGAYVNGESVSSAIENLLFSADESVNTNRAVDKLEAARRRLWHKSKKGGEIYDLECRRDELARRFAESKKYSADTAALEDSVTTCRAELAKNTRRVEELKRLTSLSEASALKKRFEILHAHEAKIKSLDGELAGLSGGDADEEAKLATLRTRMEDAKTAAAALANSKAALDRFAGEDLSTKYDAYLSEISDMGGREEAEFVFDSHLKGKTTCLISFFLLIFIALLVGAAAALTYLEYLLIPFEYWRCIAAASALPIIGAILCLVRRGGHSRYVKRHLAAVDAIQPSDYALGLENLFEIERIRETKQEEQYNASRSYETAKARQADALSALRAAVAALGGDENCTPENAITESELRIAARRELEGAKAQQETALRVSGEQLAAYSEAEIDKTLEGADLSLLEGTNINAVKREREFLISAAAALTEKLTDAEKKLAVLGAIRVSPAELSAELEKVEAQIKALTLRHDAYTLAVETLASASERLRGGISPRVSQRACRLLSSMTDGRYERLGVGEHFALSCEAEGMTRELDYLSSGTRDLTYVALRLALVSELFRNEMPPIFFDETFARVDDERLANVLSTLDGYSQDECAQAFIFTCQTREADAARGIEAKMIRL